MSEGRQGQVHEGRQVASWLWDLARKDEREAVMHDAVLTLELLSSS